MLGGTTPHKSSTLKSYQELSFRNSVRRHAKGSWKKSVSYPETNSKRTYKTSHSIRKIIFQSPNCVLLLLLVSERVKWISRSRTKPSSIFSQLDWPWWLKNTIVKLGSSPRNSGAKIKHLWNHHRYRTWLAKSWWVLFFFHGWFRMVLQTPRG